MFNLCARCPVTSETIFPEASSGGVTGVISVSSWGGVGVKARVALPSGSDPGASVCIAGACGTEVDGPETWQPRSAAVRDIMIRIIHTYLIGPPSNEHTRLRTFSIRKGSCLHWGAFGHCMPLCCKSGNEFGDQKVTLVLYFKKKL